MSSDELAVSVRGLSKSYTIRHGASDHITLAETALARLRHPFHRQARETFWALRDVDLDVRQGEVLGVIGRNGAGKSTLLKVLSRITDPSEGRIDLWGRVGSLLEVGTGFHPELTGRENIYLSGAILGMRRMEIRRKFDEIVEFADIGAYIDTPVKRYSSGMQVRLGFGVAAHLESEILIVDEVLAVGDASFQRKCLGKLEDVAHGGGRTVLFVSHNLQAVIALCDVAVYLDRGRLVEAGEASTVVRSYLERTAANTSERAWSNGEGPGDGGLRLVAVRIVSADGAPLTSSLDGEEVTVEIEVDREDESAIALGFDLEREDGTVVMSSFLPAGFDVPMGRSRLRARIPPGLLNSGSFAIGPRGSRSGTGQVFHAAGSVQFEVISADAQPLFGLRRQGAVAPPLPWSRAEGER